MTSTGRRAARKVAARAGWVRMAVTLSAITLAGAALAQDARPRIRQVTPMRDLQLPQNLSPRTEKPAPKLDVNDFITVQPGGAINKRRIEAPVLAGLVCMWHHDPGGTQPHFMMSGTCPAPEGARIGDPCQCREHGDQHRGYIDGEVVAGSAGGEPPVLH